jgi:hypothetical protein
MIIVKAFYKIIIILYFVKVIELSILFGRIGVAKTGSITEGIALWIFGILLGYVAYTVLRVTILTLSESRQRKAQCYVNKKIKEA